MNIDWSKAPEWANYHAIDKNGVSYWYEERPGLKLNVDKWVCGEGNCAWRDNYSEVPKGFEWQFSLTKRPKEVENMESDKITIDSNNIPCTGQMYYDPSTSQSKIFHNGQTYTSDEFEAILNENSILKAQVELLKELIKEMK